METQIQSNNSILPASPQLEKENQNDPLLSESPSKLLPEYEENTLHKEESIYASKQSIAKSQNARLDKKSSSVFLPPLNHHSPKKQPTFQDEKQKSERIKRLTLENKRLIEEMRRLNQKLSEMVTKQASKSLRRRPVRGNSDSEVAKELQEAYRQIDTYKKLISKQRSKELPIEQMARITDLENKLRSTEAEASSIRKQIKTVDEIKTMQDKEISRTESEGPRAKMMKLVQEIQYQKEELKSIRKEAARLEESVRPQHEYLVYLEKLQKELTDNKQKKESVSKEVHEATEEDWQELIEQLRKGKEESKEFIKKIEGLKKQKAKVVSDWEVLELRLKEKSKQLGTVEKKYHDTRLLMVTLKSPKTEQEGSESPKKWVEAGGMVLKSQKTEKGESETPKKKEVGAGEIVNMKHQKTEKGQGESPKKWEVEGGGKGNEVKKKKVEVVGELPDESEEGLVKFSDYSMFPDKVLRIKMNRILIWLSQDNQVAGLQVHYLLNQHKIVEGTLIGYCEEEPQTEIDLSNNEVTMINGRIDERGFIVYLEMQMESGKVTGVGDAKGEGSEFSVNGEEEYLECLEGGFASGCQRGSIWQLKFHFTNHKLLNTA